MTFSTLQFSLSAQDFLPNPFSWSERFSFKSITFQTRALFYSSLRPLFSALFFIALPVFLIKKAKEKPFLFFWILFPVFFFSFLVTLKHTRFLMPALPAMALITAVGLCHIKSRTLRALIFLSGIIFAFFQFYILSYVSHNPTGTVLIRGFSLLGGSGFGSGYETFDPPHNETFKINKTFNMVDDVVRFIEKTSSTQDPVILLIKRSGLHQLPDFQWAFRMLLRHPSFKFFFIEGLCDGLNPVSEAVLDPIDFVVCQYSGSSRITPERFTTIGLEALLRSSEKWGDVENWWERMSPAQWENFLKILVKYNDQFDRVLYETDKENNIAILIYQKKR